MSADVRYAVANGKPNPHLVAARLAEIDRRYRRRKRKHSPYDPIKHRLNEVWKVAKHRRRLGCLDFNPSQLMDAIRSDPKAWTPKSLGRFLHMTWEQRCRLGLRTITADLPPAELAKRKREWRRLLAWERQRKRRAKRRQHRKPPISTTQPWLAEGISRRTWYRRRAQRGTKVVTPPSLTDGVTHSVPHQHRSARRLAGGRRLSIGA